MYNKSHCLPTLKKIIYIAIFSMCMISFISCSDEEIKEEIVDTHKREGIIKLYTDGKKLVFSEITEYPFVKSSANGIGYDTIGVSYTGYRDESRSIIGSLQIIILHDNLDLHYIEYRYPTSEMAATCFYKWNDNPNDSDPFEYNIKEEANLIKGDFKTSLYPGGAYEHEGIAVDSCFFNIKK